MRTAKMKDHAMINLGAGTLWRKPRFLARAAYHYLRRHLLGKRTVTSINIAFDYRCNLHCEHCFATALAPRTDRVLDLEAVRRVADQAARLGCLNIGFQGGEPTAWKQLPELIAAIDPGRFLVNIYTNGTLLDEPRLAALKQAGLDMVCFSLDSGLAAEHDRFRGRQGTFERVMRAIAQARRTGLLVKVCTTVVHGAVFTDGFRELVAQSRELKLPTNLIIATPAGNWAGRDEVLLDEAELAHVEQLCQTDPLFYRDIHHHFGYSGCKAVDALYLTQTGDVLPCPFIHLSLGNVMDEPLADIFRRGSEISWFAEPASICLAGERGPFMDQVMARTFDTAQTPVPVEQVIELSGKSPVRS